VLQFEEREGGREGGMVKEYLYLFTKKRVVGALRPGVSGLGPESPVSPEYPGKNLESLGSLKSPTFQH
jgi:hypothetical protein